MVHGSTTDNRKGLLQSEWAVDHPNNAEALPSAFQSENIRVVRPHVTKQNDKVSCGLFLLNYAEQFLTKRVRHVDLDNGGRERLHVLDDDVAHGSMSIEFPRNDQSTWKQQAREHWKDFIKSVNEV